MTGRCAWIVWHKPLELDHLAGHTDDSPEGCLPLFYGRSLSLCTCSDAAPNGCSSSHAPGSKTVCSCVCLQQKDVSSSCTWQPHLTEPLNAHVPREQLQVSKLTPVNPAAPRTSRVSSSNFPSHCPLRRCQDQRWSSGVNPQGLVQSQLQSPESFSLNLKDLD